jgi:serine protease AprX
VVASADLSGEWSFSDSYGHGTFMAGLIAGGGQGGGPAGVAPGADLVDLKVAGADGSTTLGQVLAAMQLADASRERFNLRVLNVSLGAPADDRATAPLTEAVERLWADGITVVTAAGNEAGGVDAPGLDPYVLTVGALDPAQGAVPPGAAAGRTSPAGPSRTWWRRGSAWSACAPPGSTIDLANPAARVGDRYFRGSGTSMSTAMVAGAAALVAATHPDWGPDRVKAALTGTATPLGRPGSGAGADDTAAWTAHPPLSGRWTADGAAAKSWAARSWAGLDWTARSWASRRWTAGTWAARSWARRP